MTTKRCVHDWERFAYTGSGLAPILCRHCATPMVYPPERLIIWHHDPLIAAQMMDRADACMALFAHRGMQ